MGQAQTEMFDKMKLKHLLGLLLLVTWQVSPPSVSSPCQDILGGVRCVSV